MGLVIKTVYQLAQVVTAMEKFAFQQPPKYRQRRCTLHRWRQTVPHMRTSDTECTVAYGSPSRSWDVQSGRGRGSKPSARLQGCYRLYTTVPHFSQTDRCKTGIACYSPNRPTYDVFLNFFTYLFTYLQATCTWPHLRRHVDLEEREC